MRRRRDDTLDRDVARELAAIDAVLADEPVAPELADLETVVREAREDRPRPSDDFAGNLDERMRGGFVAERERRPRGLAAVRLRLHRRMLLPALGVAATLVVGIVLVTSLVGGKDAPTLDSSSKSIAPASVDASKPAPSAAATPPDESASTPAPRKVDHDASLRLDVAPDRVDDVSQQVIHVTDGAGGVVANSSVSSGEGSGGASFELRIPTERLQTTLARLSTLAHVRSRQESSQDVTDSFNAAKARLDQALAERSSLLRQLARATTPNQSESIRARLRISAGEITQARRGVNELRRRTSLATVQVTIDERKDAGGTGSGAWTPDDALGDAARILEVSLGVLVVTLAVAVPLAAVLALAGLAASTARRRRREQALASG